MLKYILIGIQTSRVEVKKFPKSKIPQLQSLKNPNIFSREKSSMKSLQKATMNDQLYVSDNFPYCDLIFYALLTQDSPYIFISPCVSLLYEAFPEAPLPKDTIHPSSEMPLILCISLIRLKKFTSTRKEKTV